MRTASQPTDDSHDPERELNFARRKGDLIGDQTVALGGLAGFCAAWAITSHTPSISTGVHLILFVALTVAPMVLFSVFLVKTHLRRTSGLLPESGRINYARLGIKLLGFLGTMGFLAFCYWLFPEYSKPRYAPVWEAATLIIVPVTIATAFYFAWIDCRMQEPKDAYWHCGMLFLGKWKSVNWEILREYGLGWFIKGFFLPFMLSGVVENATGVLADGWNPTSFGFLYLTSISIIYCVDTIFGAVGYLLTLRILDAEIRSPQPLGIGWVATLICYPPWSQAMSSFLKYRGPVEWSDWLKDSPVFFITWGFAILVLLSIYLWATLSFGCRFSNLTNRGIIIDGPYRYLKHPAYLTKNLAWWLMYVPFVSHISLADNLRACFMLAVLNGIYYVRAKTEERHLMADPAYRLYARWIEMNGLVASIRWIGSVRRQRSASIPASTH